MNNIIKELAICQDFIDVLYKDIRYLSLDINKNSTNLFIVKQNAKLLMSCVKKIEENKKIINKLKLKLTK